MRTQTLTQKRALRLRKALTGPELGLWLHLKNRRLGGFKFRLQHPIGPYIVDFYCAEARLAVEIDGYGHSLPDQVAHDLRRDAYFRAMGIETLRLGTSLLKSPAAAAQVVVEALRRPHAFSGGEMWPQAVVSEPCALSTASRSPSPASGGGRA